MVANSVNSCKYVAALKAEMKMFKWMFALGTSVAVLALMGAVLAGAV